jgi:hypothetical protein
MGAGLEYLKCMGEEYSTKTHVKGAPRLQHHVPSSLDPAGEACSAVHLDIYIYGNTKTHLVCLPIPSLCLLC